MAAGHAAIVIPAFNEAATIGQVVRSALAHGRVIVVDDGSADATAAEAAAAGAAVVRHERNRGYDAALESGLRAALEQGAACAVSIDADGQLEPQSLPAVLGLLRGGKELVLGCREHPARWSEALFNAWAQWRYGVPDILCGLKGYDAGLLRMAGSGVMAGSIGTGLALWGLRHGARCGMVKAPVHPRQGKPRLGSSLRANAMILRALALALKFSRNMRGAGSSGAEPPRAKYSPTAQTRQDDSNGQ